jgi:hypothetical protein
LNDSAGQTSKLLTASIDEQHSDFVDRTVSGQEDLLVAFQELFTAPTARHVFALMLAAFIDVVVFLLVFATGEQQLCLLLAANSGCRGSELIAERYRFHRDGPLGGARTPACRVHTRVNAKLAPLLARPLSLY